ALYRAGRSQFRMNCSTRQFLAFSIVGVINTVVHFAVFMLFLRLFQVPLLIASTIGYCAGIVNSYCINRLWTFKVRSRATVQEFLCFTTVNLLSLGANLVLLSYLNTAIGLGPRSEEHTSELQSRENLVCRLLLE